MSRAITIETGCDWCDVAPVPDDEVVLVVMDGREVDLCHECGRIITDLASKGRKAAKGPKPKALSAGAVNRKPRAHACPFCPKVFPTKAGQVVHTGRMHKTEAKP